LLPITGCHVPSGEACRRARKQRSDEIDRVRSIASGKDVSV